MPAPAHEEEVLRYAHKASEFIRGGRGGREKGHVTSRVLGGGKTRRPGQDRVFANLDGNETAKPRDSFLAHS